MSDVAQASIVECVLENFFLYFSSKTYVVGTQKNRLNEMDKKMDKKIIAILPSLKFLIWSLWMP